MGWLGQAELIPNTNFHAFFNIQRINGLSLYEILELKNPLIFETRKLAFRQEYRTPNEWFIEVEVYMAPVIDLTPDQPAVNPTISTSKIPTSVSIAGTSTAPIKLLTANANGTRKDVTFYNPSTKRNLYIDTDATISTASAVAKVPPGKVYITDLEDWQGEYWGMMDSSDTVPTVIAIEEYV